MFFSPHYCSFKTLDKATDIFPFSLPFKLADAITNFKREETEIILEKLGHRIEYNRIQ